MANLKHKTPSRSSQHGFTLMEIMVATVIFAIVAVALTSLFNYILKINRRGQALREASQGARDFVEFLVKEIRNGQIDYSVSNGSVYTASIGSSPCGPPPLFPPTGQSGGGAIPATNAPSTYYTQDNRLAIINTDNVEECFYYGTSNGTYVDSQKTSPTTFSQASGTLVLQKGTSGQQILNPPNFQINSLVFLVRPACDPYTPDCKDYSNGYPKIQPSVGIIMEFTAKLPTGEQVPIYYQTSVSSQKYDIPN